MSVKSAWAKSTVRKMQDGIRNDSTMESGPLIKEYDQQMGKGKAEKAMGTLCRYGVWAKKDAGPRRKLKRQ